MGRDIPLGRIAGIKVGMNVTVLLVAGLYTFILATNRLPIEQPGHSATAYWLAGGVGAVLLFLSLLAHEIGHALVARDEGIGVRSMALTLLGGVTRLESSPATAGAELRVSVVGPLASAACGVVLLCISFLIPNQGLPGLWGRVYGLIGSLNLLLAGFNLLPASPLDGGKVLSGLIWLRTGRQGLSVKLTAWVGIAVGAALIIWGIGDARGNSPTGYGLWGVVVGGFILFSATRELRSAPLFTALEGVRVQEAMTVGAPTAPAGISLAAFIRTQQPSPELEAFAVVGDANQVSGVLTAAAVRAVPLARWEGLRIGDLAFPLDRVVTVSPEDPLLPAVQRIEGADVQIGLVVDRTGTVVGTLSPAALQRAVNQRRAGLVPAG